MPTKEWPRCTGVLRDGSRCTHVAKLCVPCSERQQRESVERAAAAVEPELVWLEEWDKDIAHLPAPVRALIKKTIVEAPTFRDRLTALEYISSKMRPAAGDANATLQRIRLRGQAREQALRSMSDEDLRDLISAQELGLLDVAPED